MSIITQNQDYQTLNGLFQNNNTTTGKFNIGGKIYKVRVLIQKNGQIISIDENQNKSFYKQIQTLISSVSASLPKNNQPFYITSSLNVLSEKTNPRSSPVSIITKEATTPALPVDENQRTTIFTTIRKIMELVFSKIEDASIIKTGTPKFSALELMKRNPAEKTTYNEFNQQLPEYFKWFKNNYSSLLRITKDKEDNVSFHAKNYVEKKDLPPGSQITVRADLHGNIKTLREMLNVLKEKGLLDDQYKCKENVQLVFLGDYVDRGGSSLDVLQLLIALKMENPNQVTLIQGNHESVSLNKHENLEKADSLQDHPDGNFKECLKEMPTLMSYFYQTLPLALLVSEKTNDNIPRQYTLFSHALFELTYDAEDLINSPNDDAIQILSERKLSERIQKLAKEFEEKDIDCNTKKLKERPNRNASNEIKEAFILGIAAYKIKFLVEEQQSKDKNLPEDRKWMSLPYDCFTTFNSADVHHDTTSLQVTDNFAHNIRLSKQDIGLYFKLNHIKNFFRGHQHENHATVLREEAQDYFICTLPTAAWNEDSFVGRDDIFLILTLSPDKWTATVWDKIGYDGQFNPFEPVPIDQLKSKINLPD